MIWVGLTGGIASGKSTAAAILRRWGFPVIDADQIAKDVVGPGTPGLAQIVKTFGPGLLGSDQSLDRKKMAELVFSKPNELQRLEAIIHPLVRERTLAGRDSAEKSGAAFAFYDVPLLFEKNMQQDFDLVVVVSCSETLQKARLKSRNGMTDAEINARLKNQIPLSQKSQKADFVVENETSESDLEIALKGLLEFIRHWHKRN